MGNFLRTDHPLLDGLEGFWLPVHGLQGGSRLYDLSGWGRHGTLSGSVGWSHTKSSPYPVIDTTGGGDIHIPDPDGEFAGEKATVLVYGDFTPDSGRGYYISKYNTAENTRSWTLWRDGGSNGTSVNVGKNGGSSFQIVSSGEDPTLLKPGSTIGFTFDSGVIDIYHNGAIVHSDTATISSLVASSADVVIADRENGDRDAFYLGYGWLYLRGVASETVMRALHHQARRGFPSLLNRRDQSALYVSTAGAVITASFTEGAQAAESFSVSATLSASMNEGALGSDTLGSTSTLTDAIAEGAQGGETWATTLTALASIDEGALSTEQFTATVFTAIQAAIQEDSQASDAFLSTLQAKADLLEGASASETFTGSVIGPDTITAAITEAAQAGESVTATASLIVELIEGATSSETLAASAILRAALTESGQAGDTFTAQVLALILANISETAEAGETFSAQTDLTATLTESALAGSTFTASSTLRGGITEGAAASEQIAVLTASRWLEGTIRIAAKLAGTPDVEDKLDGSPNIEPKD